MVRKTVLGLVAGGVLLGSQPARAAEVSVTSSKRLTVRAQPGETNAITITASGTMAVISDTGAPLSAGPGCTLDAANQATCANVLRATATLGDGDDLFRNDTAIPSYVAGNAGNDTIYGGSGDDTLLGEGGIDQIYGREGADRINTRGGLADLVDCGPGADTVIYDTRDHLSSSCETGSASPPPASGPGEAPPPSSSGTRPVPVVLPSPPGTASPIRVAVPAGACATQFVGTRRSDRIDGTGQGDRMFGLRGRDVLNGLGGGDCLFGMDGADRIYAGDGADRLHGGSGPDLLIGGNGADRLWGENGADRLLGGDGNDRLFGGRGADHLAGGRGNDLLVGGRGRNRYAGGPGNDSIDARNGARDRINCGSGVDRARVDPFDRVAGCERLLR